MHIQPCDHPWPVETHTTRLPGWAGGGVDHRTEWYCEPPQPGVRFQVTAQHWRIDHGEDVREIRAWKPLP